MQHARKKVDFRKKKLKISSMSKELAAKVVGVRLPETTKDKLKALSDKYQVSVSTLVRIAVNRLIQDANKEEGISL